MIDHPRFPAAILKGVIEHGDGTIYFGSLGGWAYYRDCAIALGWLCLQDKKLEATPAGHAFYASSGLASLPRKPGSRSYSWDWKHIKFPS